MTHLYSPWRAWYALAIFVIQGIAAGIDIIIVTLLVHPIESTFRIGDLGFAAVTATPVAIGVAIAGYPAGVLADTFSRRAVIVVGSLIWIGAALATAHAQTQGSFFLLRLLAGIGIVIPGPAIFSILTDAFPRDRRSFALSIFNVASAIGGGIGFAFCGDLVEATRRNGIFHLGAFPLTPLQQCFIVVAIVGVISLAFILTLDEVPRGQEVVRTEKASLSVTFTVFGKYLQRHWLLWTLLNLAGIVAATGLVNVGTWGPKFGERQYGASGPAPLALLGIFSAAGGLVGSIIGGVLAQRGINHGNPRIIPRMLVVWSAISCVFIAAFPYMPSWVLALAFIGIATATNSAVGLLTLVAIQETAPNEVRGQLASVGGIITPLATIGGPMLAAYLAAGVFAKAGGLGPSLAVIGAVTGVLSVGLFALCGAPYERAKYELQSASIPLSAEIGSTP